MTVTFADPPPTLESALMSVALLARAYRYNSSDDLKDIREADLIDLVGNLHRRAMELHRIQHGVTE